MADARAAALRKQFIVDCQTHFVRDDYTQQLLVFSADFAKKHWNPDIPGSEGLTRYKFQNYVKEIFIDSDTKVAMISGTPTDDYQYLFLTNDQIASARDVVNKVAGIRRTPGARHRDSRHARLVRGDHARHDRPQARQHQGLHHR